MRETFILYEYKKCTQYLNNTYGCEKDYDQKIYAYTQPTIQSLRSSCPSP